MIKFRCTVTGVEDTAFKGVKRAYFEGRDMNLRGYFEYPAEKLKEYSVSFFPGESINISLDERRDEQYTEYTLYMSGIVYYGTRDRLRISIGGLIFEISGDIPLFDIGRRVYIGIMR